MHWKVTFYSSKVEAQTLDFPSGILANFLHIAEMVEALGPNLGKPIYQIIGFWPIRNSGKRARRNWTFDVLYGCRRRNRDIAFVY